MTRTAGAYLDKPHIRLEEELCCLAAKVLQPLIANPRWVTPIVVVGELLTKVVELALGKSIPIGFEAPDDSLGDS